MTTSSSTLSSVILPVLSIPWPIRRDHKTLYSTAQTTRSRECVKDTWLPVCKGLFSSDSSHMDFMLRSTSGNDSRTVSSQITHQQTDMDTDKDTYTYAQTTLTYTHCCIYSENS
ncbi:hypothetical protein FGIG_02933 [Fasciola gigantica]|uniref:Uncharacterized protein n=1 Tax=Fasciola gigantica TaxID=46835 RepID=A0A504Y805_FASGI|nr:hypothetical protein FGIG_02933 [Fasciola gigantica]